MKFLLISQAQEGNFINILNSAIKQNGGSLEIFSRNYPNLCNDIIVNEAPRFVGNSFKNRIKSWFSFVAVAKKFIKTNIHKFDAVMFTSNPPVNQSLVRYVQKRGKKSIYLIWDIYPDCIEKTFGKKVSPITYFWRKINNKVYKKCDAVLTIGDVMKENILKSYPDIDVQVIPYHADTEFIRPVEKSENPFVKENGLLDKKVFMYSGKMGFGHGFDELLQVATQLKEREDIMFLFVGHGSAYESIENYIKENKLTNTKILPYQPLEMLPFSLGAADVSFITIKEETDGLFLPSKVYDAMASGSAIICISGGNNDVARMVEKDNVGIQVKNGNVDELKAAVLRLADDEETLLKLQQNARELAVNKYRIEVVTEQYSKVFENVTNMKG